MINTKEEKEKVTLLEVLRQIKWTSIILCIGVFLMSRVAVFDNFYTLGICYIGALFFDKDIRRWGALIGILGLISMGLGQSVTVKYILMILLLWSIRGYMGLCKMEFNTQNQSIITGLCIFAINLIAVIIAEPTIYKVLIVALEGAVGVGLVIIFSYSTEIIYTKKCTHLTDKESISMIFLIACMLGGTLDFYVQVPVFNRIFFRDVVIFIIMIAATYLGNMHAGTTLTLVLSILLVLIGYVSPEMVVVYALAAFIGGLFSVLGRIGVMIAMGLGLILGFNLFNHQVMDLSIIGAYLSGAVISLVIPRNYFGMAEWFKVKESTKDEQYFLRLQNIMIEQVNGFSKAFADLSQSFDKIVDKKLVLNEKDIKDIIESTGEKMCMDCAMKNFCWKDYLQATYKSGYEMINLIEKKGTLQLTDIPECFSKSCINPENFAFSLSFSLEIFKRNMIWKNRLVEMRNLIGSQFEAVSSSLQTLASTVKNDINFNREYERMIKNYLYNKGINVQDAIVLELRGHVEAIHLFIDYRIDKDLKEKLVKYIATAIDEHVEMEKFEYAQPKGYCYFKLKLQKQFGISASAVMRPKEKVSGDVFSYRQIVDGQYLLALADGMGSGEEAQAESTATMELFEDLMASGFERPLAVQMINSMLVLKSDIESFSTMDVTIVDEYTGIAEFLKMGAASSFILRGNEVTTIRSDSLPLGILEHIDVEVYQKQLQDGDIIVMVTDGMLESKNEYGSKEDTFKHFILEMESHNPEYMAKHLMQKCVDLLGGGDQDDMTVLVARVWKQQEALRPLNNKQIG